MTHHQIDLQLKFREGVIGKITQWHAQKGFGFIYVEDANTDVFFRYHVFIANRTQPKLGDKVIVCAERDGVGWRAVSVYLPDWGNLKYSYNQRNPQTLDARLQERLDKGVVGKIINWNEDLGLGMIQIFYPAMAIVFQIAAFTLKSRAPVVGESVYVSVRYDGYRWSATAVTPLIKNEYLAKFQEQFLPLYHPMVKHLCIAVIGGLAWWLALIEWYKPMWLLSMVLSVVMFFVYAWDKYCEIEHRSTIPTWFLHVGDVLGGWVGSMVARYLFRHKTQTQPFVQIFWVTVALNVAITVHLVVSGSLQL
ncbi:cold shock and DUF1294 domain-containing protein [Simonsiella muelleri]|uniref:cold shock and DUF1294 domain-containing protein n=1 Tax=Simonsiella muelleri TaxID=72 RepID=UPI0023F0A635|nr:cold shock and DUF1294 domain-containing protein [Simonsiella muelleri]